MTFNIGSQSGGVVNNVAGDQHVEGGQHGVQISREDAASAASALRDLLAGTDLSALSDDDRAAVHEDATAISDEMASPKPAPDKVVGHLERLASVLKAAGLLVGAGSALLGPLSAIATWLGPLGTTVLGMLPAL